MSKQRGRLTTRRKPIVLSSPSLARPGWEEGAACNVASIKTSKYFGMHDAYRLYKDAMLLQV